MKIKTLNKLILINAILFAISSIVLVYMPILTPDVMIEKASNYRGLAFINFLIFVVLVGVFSILIIYEE